MTQLNEFSLLQRVLVRPPHHACARQSDADAQWRTLNFTGCPDLALAQSQHEALRELLLRVGAQVDECPPDGALTLDAIYVRDAAIPTPRGMILGRMGKQAREHEPATLHRVFEASAVPVAGSIEPPGLIEGGDVVWFDDRTVAVGRGYRTNDAGISQLRTLLGSAVDVVVVPLPHYRGPTDVFHLMSIISPVDRDLAVVYSPLMPVPFRQWLCARGIGLVEVPDTEFETMGANVLALAPRECVMLEGNPTTRARLEAAGARVTTYEGSEISVKGGGGPTCLTRALLRS
jgi:N-dimethylarginine dimethylaminohydrolase